MSYNTVEMKNLISLKSLKFVHFRVTYYPNDVTLRYTTMISDNANGMVTTQRMGTKLRLHEGKWRP